jgi:hypothetical protein
MTSAKYLMKKVTKKTKNVACGGSQKKTFSTIKKKEKNQLLHCITKHNKNES